MATHPAALYTRADLDDFPDDGKRYEIIDGVLFVSPMARARHQRVVGKIARRIDEWVDTHHGVVYPGVNVDLSPNSHLEPDVAWAEGDDDPGVGYDHTPAFIAEVASRSTRVFDRNEKLARYAATGCREFWIVDLDRDTIEVFVVSDAEAGAPIAYAPGETFTSALFDGLTFEVDDLLCIS